MSFQKHQVLVDKLTFLSFKTTFNTLIEIRTKLTKSKDDINRLLECNIIPKLLNLLKPDLQSKSKFTIDERRKTTDIIFSILGNLCMQGTVRKHVEKHGGISIIVEHLCESESGSLQNRSCRALANLALDPSNCFLIHKTDAVKRIVHLLECVENKDCLLTFCRAIRLLGHTVVDNEKLVQANAVTAVAKLMKSPLDEVRNCSIRTIHDLSKVSCCSNFASQILAADVLEVLLKFAADPDDTLSQNSSSILFQVLEQENIRPAFGAAGGISYFLELIQSTKSNMNKLKILNVICLCSKEAVNRVKIRELGGLQILLDRLSDAEFRSIHNRIISTFLCYLYDEHSLNVLLENGLIPLLIQHMRKCIHVDATSQLRPRSLVSSKAMSVSTNQFYDVEMQIHTFDCRDNMMHLSERIPVGNSQFTSLPSTQIPRQPNLSCIESDSESFSSTNREVDGANSRDHLYRFSVNSPTYRAENDWDIPGTSFPKCKKSFHPVELSSPHSPSSPSSFSPLSSVSYYSNDYSPPYSPDFALRSPGSGSPPNSPDFILRSPGSDTFGSDFICSSPIITDTETWSPPYPESVSSPLKNNPPKNNSRMQIDGNTVDSVEELDMRENEETVTQEEKGGGNDSVIVFEEISNTFSENLNCQMISNSTAGKKIPSNVAQESISNFEQLTNFSSTLPSGQGETQMKVVSKIHSDNNNSKDHETDEAVSFVSAVGGCVISRPRPLSMTESGCDDSVTCTKVIIRGAEGGPMIRTESDGKVKNLKRKSSTDSSSISDNKRQRVKTERRVSDILMERNILMILSRASQMPDPVKQLVTPDVISCLLDYMSTVESIDTRSCRLFSRLLRNPLCFDKLMDFHIPLLIYSELLIDCSGHETFEYTDIKSRHTKMFSANIPQKLISRSSSENAILSHSLSQEDAYFKSIARLGTLRSTSLDISMESEEGKECSDEKIQNRSITSDEEVRSDITHHALSFLECLCFVLNSCYGRGVVAGFLKKASVTEEERQWLAVCIPFLCWNREMQHYFLLQMGILEELFQIIEDQISSNLWQYAICSLSFLVKLKDIKLDLHYSDTRVLRSTFIPLGEVNSLKSPSKDIPHNYIEPSEMELKCIYQELKSCYDLTFYVGNTEVKACRDKLIDSSVVFSAMLAGQYSESSQSSVTLKDTPRDALVYILHYLHGCDLKCDVISEFLSTSIEHTCNINSGKSLRKCLQVISMADKYLLLQLSDFLKSVVISRFLTCKTAVQIYHFADFHEYSKMALDSLKSILAASKGPSDLLSIFFYCMQSSISHRFLDSMKRLITDVINPS